MATAKSTTEKSETIFIIGAVEAETRKLADALATGHHICAAPGLEEAAGRMAKESFSAVIFDLVNDDSDLAGTLASLQSMAPETPVIVLGHPNDAQIIVKAIKAGAFDFVTKPYPP